MNQVILQAQHVEIGCFIKSSDPPLTLRKKIRWYSGLSSRLDILESVPVLDAIHISRQHEKKLVPYPQPTYIKNKASLLECDWHNFHKNQSVGWYNFFWCKSFNLYPVHGGPLLSSEQFMLERLSYTLLKEHLKCYWLHMKELIREVIHILRQKHLCTFVILLRIVIRWWISVDRSGSKAGCVISKPSETIISRYLWWATWKMRRHVSTEQDIFSEATTTKAEH